MSNSIRLVQLEHPVSGRQVALVQESSLLLLAGFSSVYDLALDTIHSNKSIKEEVYRCLSGQTLDYDVVHAGNSTWKWLPSFDCPGKPEQCLVSGTGLTHKSSALQRNSMHQEKGAVLTDSMVMYQWGEEGGHPEKNKPGIQPEWFYKGAGHILKAHRESLDIPAYANDGGEEPEVATVYVIDQQGQPYRVGFTTGNEFSDHVMERKNYLYLAPSKLRECAIGPELVIDADFSALEGVVQVKRNQEVLWEKNIKSGEGNMAHSLANLEYHHFKYAAHRIPGQAHVHFLGADAFSFGAGIRLATGDETVINWKGLGRPLINTIQVTATEEKYIAVKSIL